LPAIAVAVVAQTVSGLEADLCDVTGLLLLLLSLC
jgi:hypothetical protein